MIEEPTYEFCCWNCDNTTDVEFSTIQEMIADATSGGWHVGKGRCYCPECSAKNNKLLKAKTRDNTLKAKKRPEVKDEQVSTK